MMKLVKDVFYIVLLSGLFCVNDHFLEIGGFDLVLRRVKR
jgi:hypothetical protein